MFPAASKGLDPGGRVDDEQCEKRRQVIKMSALGEEYRHEVREHRKIVVSRKGECIFHSSSPQGYLQVRGRSALRLFAATLGSGSAGFAAVCGRL